MASALKVLGVGLTGVEPQLFFLNTDQILSVVISAGYIQAVAAQEGLALGTKFLVLASYNNGSGGTANDVFVPSFSGSVITLVPVAAVGGITGGEALGENYPIFAGVDGTTMQFNGIAPGTNVTMELADGTITVSSSGGGSSHTYPLALWVDDIDGNDGGTGQEDDPLLTYTQAMVNIGTNYGIIYGINGNVNNGEQIATPGLGGIYIICAPGTTFNGGITITSGDTNFTMIANSFFPGENVVCNSAGATVIFSCQGQFNCGGANAPYSQSSGHLYINAPLGIAAVTLSGSVTAYLSGCNYYGTNYSLVLTTGANVWTLTPFVGTYNDGSAYINGLLGTTVAGLIGNNTFSGNLEFYNLGSLAYRQSNIGPTAAGQYLISAGGSAPFDAVWGAGYTPFAYDYGYWFASDGSDLFLGTSIETPFQTLQNSINQANTGLFTPIYGVNGIPNGETVTTLNDGQKFVLIAPALSLAEITVQTTDTAVINALEYGTITNNNSGSTFNVDLITTFNNTSGCYIDTNTITTFNNSGSFAIIDCIQVADAEITAGLVNINATGINNTSITNSGASTVSVSSLSGLYIDTSESSSVYLLSPYNASITNDGTSTVKGFAGSTIYGAANQDNQGYFTATIDATALYSSLAGGGNVSVVIGVAPGNARYKVSNIYLNYGGTNFSGIGGDRDLLLTDGTTSYTVIPAAVLQALATVNAGWGSVSVPFPASAAINTLTSSGADLYLIYTNGTTDYTAGSVTITVEYARVA